MVVPLTSNLLRAQAAGNVLLQPRDTGLDRASVALACQVMTVDKRFLAETVGTLPSKALRSVSLGLQLTLSLDSSQSIA